MTNREDVCWLESVLVRARNAGWCTRPYCTTCMCGEFRHAVWATAARRAGIDCNIETVRLPHNMIAGISNEDREAVFQTVIAGLQELPPRWTDSDAFRIVMMDTESLLRRYRAPSVLYAALSGTAAGEALARMCTHSREVQAEREQRRVYESPQAAQERSRLKREQRAIAHTSRQAETRRKNAERSELLAALARLSPVERLSRFAKDPALILDSVSAELIPAQKRDLVGLGKAEAAALIARIDRRKGAWGRLRDMLERIVSD